MSLPAVPAMLESARGRGPDWSAWLDRLPGTTADLLAEWQLVHDQTGRSRGVWHGHTSWVLAVRTASGRPAALKVGFPHPESAQEHLALRHWDGRGAVRMLRADPHRGALLLERLPGEDLHALDDVEACETAAALYERLHVPAPASLRRLTSVLGPWLEGLAALPRDAPLPRRLVEQALSLGRDLLADPATDGRVVHGDLHYANVLAANHEPWVVIDPKPLSGDPHHEVPPLLWNRWDEVVDSGDVRTATRRRFHAVVDTAGLDENRARDWVVVRMVLNAAWAAADLQTARRAPTAEDRGWLTTCVAVAKAVQE
ncbi:MAG: aminoglycoside phosphotransferase family protein [Nocardioides sp.]|nr:aminoglycoside phosphotransferase family protein [Nocardioides sp.]